jgi:hypothetical protein
LLASKLYPIVLFRSIGFLCLTEIESGPFAMIALIPRLQVEERGPGMAVLSKGSMLIQPPAHPAFQATHTHGTQGTPIQNHHTKGNHIHGLISISSQNVGQDSALTKKYGLPHRMGSSKSALSSSLAFCIGSSSSPSSW